MAICHCCVVSFRVAGYQGLELGVGVSDFGKGFGSLSPCTQALARKERARIGLSFRVGCLEQIQRTRWGRIELWPVTAEGGLGLLIGARLVGWSWGPEAGVPESLLCWQLWFGSRIVHGKSLGLCCCFGKKLGIESPGLGAKAFGKAGLRELGYP
ncbi:unnamed protein product [Prunus armeniaca]|uniref:Uncharacterized protein n=1 Tax=Prunus armeniaca TaxID=36596 RepID=A0A6J5Y5D7_PRUAR|nr:unnamed protein product [Prunus armeniaca]